MSDGHVAGIDGCPGGWVAFKVNLTSRSAVVELVDLPRLLRSQPKSLTTVAIDIPIGLLDGPRACDIAARALLGPVRRSSVFPAACRASLQAKAYREACEINRQRSGRGLSRQAWCIGPKIKAVDDAISSASQAWALEPEHHDEDLSTNGNGRKEEGSGSGVQRSTIGFEPTTSSVSIDSTTVTH